MFAIPHGNFTVSIHLPHYTPRRRLRHELLERCQNPVIEPHTHTAPASMTLLTTATTDDDSNPTTWDNHCQ